MLSTAEIKTLRSYHLKKFRDEVGVFIAETPKLVETLITAGMEAVAVYAIDRDSLKIQDRESLKIQRSMLRLSKSRGKTCFDYAEQEQLHCEAITRTSDVVRERTEVRDRATSEGQRRDLKILEISEKELERISTLKTPNSVFAVFKTPTRTLEIEDALKGISLVLDDIRDPGNMGTILRLADWFGIDRIIASKESADVFQPKCVQASMGSVGNIPVFYEDLPSLIQKLPSNFTVYGTFMNGENIYTAPLQKQNLWFVIGNEAHGISAEVEKHIRKKISIPNFESITGRTTVAESLNAAMATAVVCSEIKRSV